MSASSVTVRGARAEANRAAAESAYLEKSILVRNQINALAVAVSKHARLAGKDANGCSWGWQGDMDHVSGLLKQALDFLGSATV